MVEYTFQFVEQSITVEATIPGSPPAAALVAYGKAVGTVSALKAVASVDGGLSVANLDDISHCGVAAGVAMTSAPDGGSFAFASIGEMEDASWHWIMSLPIHIGADGSLTQTCPSGVRFLQQIGTPTAPTKMMVRLGQPILLK